MQKAGGLVNVIEDQHVPFLHLNDQWVGFDSTDSLREKVRFGHPAALMRTPSLPCH